MKAPHHQFGEEPFPMASAGEAKGALKRMTAWTPCVPGMLPPAFAQRGLGIHVLDSICSKQRQGYLLAREEENAGKCFHPLPPSCPITALEDKECHEPLQPCWENYLLFCEELLTPGADLCHLWKSLWITLLFFSPSKHQNIIRTPLV